MTRFQLGGARVVVTGASSGIGRALAGRIAVHRPQGLVLVARRRDLLDSLAAQVTAAGATSAEVVVADLADPSAADAVADRVLAHHGGADVLVNNAGAGVGGLQWAVGAGSEARDGLQTNYWSPVALTARLVPGMRERGNGMVVNVSSLAQVMTWPGMGHYTASKAALALATETLRMELHGSGVHVLEVIPGPVDTAIQGETRLISGIDKVLGSAPLGSPDQLARLVVRAIERRRDRLVYPRSLRAAYLFPGITRAYLALQVRHATIDTDDPRVIRSGSQGDDAARAAREDWERTQARVGHAVGRDGHNRDAPSLRPPRLR